MALKLALSGRLTLLARSYEGTPCTPVGNSNMRLGNGCIEVPAHHCECSDASSFCRRYSDEVDAIGIPSTRILFRLFQIVVLTMPGDAKVLL